MSAATLALEAEAPAARAAVRIRENVVAAILIWGLCFVLTMIIALPLWALLSKSFQNAEGGFVGLANYLRYFSTPALFASLVNSLTVAVLTTVIVVPVGFIYAYALTRSCLWLKPLFYALALLPIFAPSLLSGLALVYVFGNQGLLKGVLGGVSIYGPLGIVVAQAVYCLPHAVLILVTALSMADGRLYEAAEALGTSRMRVFRTVTVPGARYGLISAVFVVFTLSITDFGIAKVIGGSYAVLATDAYKQVVGQQNFEMGAVVGMILLAPAILAFVVERAAQKRQVALLSARAVPFTPRKRASRDAALTLYCVVIGGLVLALYGVAVWASFIRYWPYNLSLTLANYDFANFEPTGWQPYLNSLAMAGAVAVLGTGLVFIGAYLIEKLKAAPLGRQAARFLALVPMAVPGLVLGLGYVFFFNASWNPLNVFYGTIAILVLNTVAHFYTTGHITATTALKQIDPEFESVSAALKVPFWVTLRRVVVPISLPAILDIATYMFVNALTTVSAVIFLYGAESKLASIAIVHMDEAGAIAGAAAMATCILLTAILARVLHIIVEHTLVRRLQAWRSR